MRVEEMRRAGGLAARGFAFGPAPDDAMGSAPDVAVGSAPSVMVGATPGGAAEVAHGAAVRFEERLPARAVVTLVNPNNPDGAVLERGQLLRLHEEVASREGYVVVDEAFADVEPACSVAPLAGCGGYQRLIVLRSFGKFYGLAGVRLGFVIGAPRIVARFRELVGDWAVSADAIAAGLTAYADNSWAERARERLRHSAHRLDDILKTNGFAIVGGTSLFRLARSDDARERFERLLHAGVLARPFEHGPTLLRFGLPAEPSAWHRLAEALRKP
jgi:cobalamin biosynthetic protein CobC